MTFLEIFTLITVLIAFAAGYGFGVLHKMWFPPQPKDWTEGARYSAMSEGLTQETMSKRTVSERRL